MVFGFVVDWDGTLVNAGGIALCEAGGVGARGKFFVRVKNTTPGLKPAVSRAPYTALKAPLFHGSTCISNFLNPAASEGLLLPETPFSRELQASDVPKSERCESPLKIYDRAAGPMTRGNFDQGRKGPCAVGDANFAAGFEGASGGHGVQRGDRAVDRL